jgi:hypothetical protein
MKKLKKRLQNPSPTGVLITLGVLAAGGGLAYYFVQDQAKSAKAKLKPKGSKPITPPGPTDGLPAPDDEYGIFINDDCSDFTSVDPPEGTDPSSHVQGRLVEKIVTEAVDAGGELDPFQMASRFLNAVSNDRCEFPPSPDAPDRIVQLYLYTVTLMAVMGVLSGGEMEGVDSESMPSLDTKIASMIEARGYLPFDPAIVPDLLPKPKPPVLGAGQEGAPNLVAIVPDYITAKDAYQQVYAQGDVDQDTQIKLFDEDLLMDIEDLEQHYYGPGNIRLEVKGMHEGLYRAFVRQSDDDAWIPTDATLEVKLPEASFQGQQPAVAGFVPGGGS